MPAFLRYQTSTTAFTASIGAAVNAQTMGSGYGSIVTLPAVDANNTSVTLMNVGQEPVLVSFGMTTPRRFADTYGTAEVLIPPGGPFLLVGSAFAAAGASATACISSRSASAGITVQRGTISSMEIFS